MAVELVIGAIAAATSLTAGLVKTFLHRKSDKAEEITVTVHRGEDTIEKHGVIRADQLPDVLGMVDEGKRPSPGSAPAGSYSR